MIKKHFSKFILILVSSFFISSLKLKAQERKSIPLKLSVGYGVLVKNNNRFDNQYDKADSNPIFLSIPFATVNYGPLHIGGGGISLSFVGDRFINGFINVNRGGERYYGVGMDQRKDSVFVGLGARYNDFMFMLSKDINGRSKGIKTMLSYSQTKIYEDESLLRLAINLEFYNKNYANYYYGVKDNEITSSRSSYTPNGYLLPGVSAFYSKRIWEKVGLTPILTLKKYPHVVTDSPTTKGTDFELSAIVGLTWIFY